MATGSLTDLEVIAYRLPNGDWYEEEINLVRIHHGDYKYTWVIQKGSAWIDREHGFWAVRIDHDCEFDTPEEAYEYYKGWIVAIPSVLVYRKRVKELDYYKGTS